MGAWLAWAIAAVLLVIGEIFTPGLFFLGPVALAAAAAAVVAAAGAPAWVQIVVFASGALASLALPPADRARASADARRDADRHGGARRRARAVVLERVDANGGRVKIGGEEWSARALHARPGARAGQAGRGREIEGATALVYE